MQAVCDCGYKAEKNTLEALAFAVKKAEGNLVNNVCPHCKKESLK